MVCALCARDSAQRDTLEICLEKDFTKGDNFEFYTSDVTPYQETRVSRGDVDHNVSRPFSFLDILRRF